MKPIRNLKLLAYTLVGLFALLTACDPINPSRPTITGITGEPNPVTQPESLTLTADGVADVDGLVSRVQFYLDGNPGQLLGVDTDYSDGWSWSGPTESFPTGEVQFFACAQNNHGLRSDRATAMVRINSGEPPPPTEACLGVNLSRLRDYNTELPFVDVFRLSRTWISQKKGSSWGHGPNLALDEHGWVERLESDCYAETLMCNMKGGHYPSGHYTVLYEGEGRIEFSNASEVSREPGRIVIDVDSNRSALWLQLTATDPEDRIRNIRVIMPGFEKTYQDSPFHPEFLKRWQGIRCLRFMDWMCVSKAEARTWDERPKIDDATFTVKKKGGAPLGIMTDLCNRLGADPWFCIPHLVDDDYIRQFAQQARDQLDPERKVYVEYSNEVWNTSFVQTKHAWAKGKELGLGDPKSPWEGGALFYSQRAVEIFGIWEDVFGGADRLVRVLAWQSANPRWAEKSVLLHQNAHQHADAYAVAPYFGMSIYPKDKSPTASEVLSWGVDGLMTHLEEKSIPKAREAFGKSKDLAEKYDLKLLAYEGGQHMVGIRGAENNDALAELLYAANADPRMGPLYEDYLAAWKTVGGDLFCHYCSVDRWTKWGSWGLMQYCDEDPTESPKFMATIRWARGCGQPVNIPTTMTFMEHKQICPVCSQDDPNVPLCEKGFRLLQEDLREGRIEWSDP
jgi:hypothetical protein